MKSFRSPATAREAHFEAQGRRQRREGRGGLLQSRADEQARRRGRRRRSHLLRCRRPRPASLADLKTGKILWKRKGGDGHGQGSASVTYADDRLYFHYDDGTVALVEPSPDGYKEDGWFKNETDGPGWAHPVVSGGQLYIREGDSLYRYDLREKP